jgi:hypothetical protein
MVLFRLPIDTRPGAPISDALRYLFDEVLPSLRPVAGGGISIDRGVISCTLNPPTFDHPFRPSLSGTDLRLTSGRLNGLEPLTGRPPQPIGGIPATGIPAPSLRLDPALRDDGGLSWIALRATLAGDADSILVTGGVPAIDLVQLAANPAPDGYHLEGTAGAPAGVALVPVALLQYPADRSAERPLFALPYVMHHLRLIALTGPGPRRWAAVPF